MKTYLILAALFCTLLLSPTFVSARQNKAAEWIRAQSDDGEFSIEVPADYTFVVSKFGFSIADGADNYSLEEMKMLNAYREKTLLSFESYRANKKALNIIRERDEENGKSTDIQRDGFSIKQIIIKTDKSYTIRQYISSKNNIYILTAASRIGETSAMKRFLNSLTVKSPDAAKPENNTISGAVLFSALKTSQIEIDESPEPYKKPDAAKPAPPASDNDLPLLLVNRHSPSYTNEARMNMETGTIQTRMTFSADGRISKIGFLKTLKFGLVRQAVFAAVRIKFLPAEKEGNPQSVTKVVEYVFHLY